jgi:putative transposase
MSKLRIDVTDVPYHVFARGNNRQPIFLDDFDRVVFLKYWKEVKLRLAYRVFTYGLMTNHFHFLMQMEFDSSISDLLQWVQFQYARYFNRKYGRVGHLFQGRFNSLLVETDSYFLTVDRYIHLNSVRAGIVSRPEQDRWNSYAARFQSNQNDWIDHQAVLNYFGKDRRAQLIGYKKFIDDGITKPEDWSLEMLQKMSCLGSARFLQEMIQRQRAKQIA